MPTFPRLGRHSNRSQHALPVDTPAAPIAAAAAAAGGGTGGAVPTQTQNLNLNLNQNHQSHNHQLGQSDSPAQTTTPQSALSTNTTFSSSQSSFADARSQHQHQHHQQQHVQQQQQPATPSGGGAHLPPHHHQQHQQQQIYANSPETGPTDSTAVDGNQSEDWIEAAVRRSQSQHQRHSTYTPLTTQQQQQLQSEDYSAGSASFEDLSSTGGYNAASQQPGSQQRHQGPTQSQHLHYHSASQPEKKSRRKLIKGIFSSRSHNENNFQPGQSVSQSQLPGHQSANSYDNTGGLARRPSKRVSNPPALNTRLGQPIQTSQTPEWTTQGHRPAENSPRQGFVENDEYQRQNLGGDAQRDGLLNETNSPINPNTIRQVGNNDSDSSPYDDTPYLQAQLHQQQGPPPHQEQQQPQQHLQQHQQPQHLPAPPSQPHVQPQYQQGQAPPHRFDQTPSDQQTSQGHSHQHQLQQFQQVQQTQQQEYPYGGVTAQPQFAPRTDSRGLPNHPTTNQHPQVTQESPARDSYDYGQAAQSSPVVAYPPQARDHTPTPSQSSFSQTPVPSTHQQQPNMAPPPVGVQSTVRRGQEVDKAQPPLGPPPGYRQPNASSGTLTPLPQGQSGSQPNSFGVPDQGRHSPQPNPDAAEGEKAFKDLLTKYKNVKRLYFDGKSQIENLSGQVEQLQNAVANQRMSQSRTALDDNEYAGRFNRLNGAINNLSFNIRKDWRSVPPWLERFISVDALKTGKQEMTAVGRAVISKWLVDEIFDSVFHPGLEPVFSAQLKDIEMGIRGNAYTMNSQEEFNALTTKIVHWRMATLDGLQQILHSPGATDNRQSLTARATTNLTACLYQYLNSPPPPGVDSSTSMIVELAIGIVANLPLESRDVTITYPLPGDIVQQSLMEVEKGELPAPPGVEVDSDSDSDLEREKGNGKNAMPKEPSRVRFAGFVALEVRGRQVLMKAPVWTL